VLWILFGALALSRPVASLFAMAMLCGTFVFVDGFLNVLHAVTEREDVEHRWLWLLIGLAGLAVGVLALANPLMTTLVLLFYIAIWAIVTGVLEIVAAIRLRKEIRGEFWLALAGIVSVGFGLLLIVRPDTAVPALLGFLGVYGIGFGAVLVVLALQSRHFLRRLSTG
jgi:uncharacterized membrane protein HdeD (DUF308 family)